MIAAQHQQHRDEHDHRVLERVAQPHPGDRAGDHKAEPIGRGHQPEGERNDPDDGELHGMHVHRPRHRFERRADDDDRWNRVEETADHQENGGDEEADFRDAHAPRGDVGQEGARDLVVGEHPAER
jgi:hypothetical protein